MLEGLRDRYMDRQVHIYIVFSDKEKKETRDHHVPSLTIETNKYADLFRCFRVLIHLPADTSNNLCDSRWDCEDNIYMRFMYQIIIIRVYEFIQMVIPSKYDIWLVSFCCGLMCCKFNLKLEFLYKKVTGILALIVKL